MAGLTAEAIVLHAFDYLESSRIVRVLTREAGVRSAVARGARRSTRRFGPSLDLFVQGIADLDVRPGRDLDTLQSFDVRRSRITIGGALERFSAASAIAELILRFGTIDADAELFATVAATFDTLADVTAAEAPVNTLAAGWRILAHLGFAPSLEQCIDCHAAVEPEVPALFNHAGGGVRCPSCAGRSREGRTLPPEARAAIREWLEDATSAPLPPLPLPGLRAHQRLLREFVHAHLADERPLRAYEMWEHASSARGAWSAA